MWQMGGAKYLEHDNPSCLPGISYHTVISLITLLIS
jgi:hypothetical protein